MTSGVLVNTYNHAAYVAACLDSVLAQDPAPSEVVVVDDGSEDGTEAVVAGYGGRVVRAGHAVDRSKPPWERQGAAIADAFAASTADILHLLDGDDRMLPGRLRAYAAAFGRDPDVVLVQVPLAWITPDGARRKRLQERFRHCPDPAAEVVRRQDADFFYPTSALAFRRRFLEGVLPLDWSDGTPLWPDSRLCLAALHAGRVVTLEEESGERRIRPASDSARRRRAAFHLVRQTLYRTRVHNVLAAKHGRPEIRAWRNPRFYLQVVRALVPWRPE